MRRLFSAILASAASVLLARWGMGITTPSADMRRAKRAIGWCERTMTQLDALATRITVLLSDAFGIDRLRWHLLRWRVRAGKFAEDMAYGDATD